MPPEHEDLWSPSACRAPKPGEYESWVQRCAEASKAHFLKKDELRQGRQAAFEERTAARAADREARFMRPVKPGPSRFTTDYAVHWGKAQGWEYIERERYDHRTRRHHDLQLAVDAYFDDGQGLVGIQGAGRHERTRHRASFEKAGGVATANRRGIRVIYLEFARGDKSPVVREDWA